MTTHYYNTLTVLLIAVLCISVSSAQFRGRYPTPHEYNTLNDSVKAVLGSVFTNLDKVHKPTSQEANVLNEDMKAVLGSVLGNLMNADSDVLSDSDRSDLTDPSDTTVYDLSSLFDESSEEDNKDNQKDMSSIWDLKEGKVQDLIDGLISKESKVFDDLVEMVAITLENLHDHSTKFIEVSGNDTESDDFERINVFKNFKDVNGLINDIVRGIVDDSVVIFEDEYIVSDGNSLDSKKSKETEKKESREDSEDFKLKDAIKTISFIKTRLGKKSESDNGPSERESPVLRRQNAMRPEDFEKYFKQEKENMF